MVYYPQILLLNFGLNEIVLCRPIRFRFWYLYLLELRFT